MTYDVIGEPTDYEGAAALAAEDKYQFQWWALGQVSFSTGQERQQSRHSIVHEQP
jgi:hypothetical protein